MHPPGACPRGAELVRHLSNANPIVTDPGDPPTQCRAIEQGHTDDLADRNPAEQIRKCEQFVGRDEHLPSLFLVLVSLRGQEFRGDRVELVHP